ncbi:hypothetical protein Tco_0785112 [Tanacetum coccineum]
MKVVLETGLEKEVAAIRPIVYKKGRKRCNGEAEANAPPKVLRKDHAAFHTAKCTLRGKPLAPMGLHLLHACYTGRFYYCEERERSRSAVLCETTTVPRARHCPIFQENGHRDPHRKCCYHGGARPVLRGESGVREIDLLPIRGRVARRYLSAGVGRDQQLPPGHPGRVPRHGRSHSTAGVLL